MTNEQPYVVIEATDNGETILAVYICPTETEAIDFSIRIVRSCDTSANIDNVRKDLEEDSFWTDGSGWQVSITQATPH